MLKIPDTQNYGSSTYWDLKFLEISSRSMAYPLNQKEWLHKNSEISPREARGRQGMIQQQPLNIVREEHCFYVNQINK